MAGNIHVTTKHNPLALLLYFTKVTLTVDGTSVVVPWGVQEQSVEPGHHEIGVSFRYLRRDMGKATISIEVADGSATSVVYKAPIFVTSSGRISIV